MSLPIAGANKSPSRPATHPSLDMGRMLQLAGELQDALTERGAEVLSPALIEDIADELGVRESHLYVAAATMSQLPCAAEGERRVEVCVGNCQKWGAVELLDRVLDLHGVRRTQQEEAGFDVVAKRCLDRCASAAVVYLHTPDGRAGLEATTVESLEAALTELLAPLTDP